MIRSERASALTPAQLERVRALMAAFPIEMAELRASPKQLRFQRAFLSRRDATGRRCDVFAVLGANRSGKSFVAGRLCFAKYLRDHSRNGDVFWCVAVTLDRSIGGQQKELWDSLPRWMFGEQSWTEKIGFGMHRKIVLPSADDGTCLIEFRSGDQQPSTFEQAKLTGVWCDERLPEGIYDRLLPRIIDRDGWILYSDIPEQWWHYARLMEAPPEAGVLYQHLEMRDNEHNLPPGAIEKASSRMTEDERKLRIRGLMVVMEGVVYRQYIDLPRGPKDADGNYTGGHLVPRFTIPKNWPKWRLIDYGGSAPTACLWVAIGPDERVYCYRTHYTRGLSIAENARMIIGASGDEVYVKTLMDPHAVDPPPIYYGAAKTIARQYADAGITATGWPFVQVLGEHAMVQRVMFRLENRTIWVFDDLMELRRELRSWKYKTDKEGKPLAADAFENDNNHLLDTLKGFLGTNPCFTQQKIEINRPPGR